MRVAGNWDCSAHRKVRQCSELSVYERIMRLEQRLVDRSREMIQFGVGGGGKENESKIINNMLQL
jgi:hypothetical protein